MSTLTTAPEVTRYLEEVRQHLADLSPEERDGLMEDLEDHLAEVAAEHGLPLEGRLGEPAAFAAELRASAGLDGPGPVGRRRWGPALSVAGSLAASPTWRRVRAFLPELRPRWWVLRGYLAVAVLSVIADGRWGPSSFPLPSLGGSAFLGLVAVALAVPASVALGRRALAATDGRGRWLDRAATTLVVLGCLGSLGTVRPVSSGPWYPVETHYLGGVGGSNLHDAEGRPITNIYAYDADGRLLDGVYLYDQEGRPLDDVSPVTEDGLPVETNYRLDANGAPVRNAYPLDVRVPVSPDRDWNGQPDVDRPYGPRPAEPLRPPAVVVPPAAPTTPTTTATTATPTTTAG